jgi:hypothetical protein
VAVPQRLADPVERVALSAKVAVGGRLPDARERPEELDAQPLREGAVVLVAILQPQPAAAPIRQERENHEHAGRRVRPGFVVATQRVAVELTELEREQRQHRKKV